MCAAPQSLSAIMELDKQGNSEHRKTRLSASFQITTCSPYSLSQWYKVLHYFCFTSRAHCSRGGYLLINCHRAQIRIKLRYTHTKLSCIFFMMGYFLVISKSETITIFVRVLIWPGETAIFLSLMNKIKFLPIQTNKILDQSRVSVVL